MAAQIGAIAGLVNNFSDQQRGQAADMAALQNANLKQWYGTYQAYQGYKDKRAAERGLSDTELQYKTAPTESDFLASYRAELDRRARVGLPEEQRLAMEMNADRVGAIGLGATEDRRAGLMGIGQQTQNLADAYRNIGLADVAARERNALASLEAERQAAISDYNKQQDILGYDIAKYRTNRQEGLDRMQTGVQTYFDAMDAAIARMPGNADDGGGLGSLGGLMQPSAGGNATGGGATSGFSMGSNNSPFAYGNGLNYTQGMSGISIGG